VLADKVIATIYFKLLDSKGNFAPSTDNLPITPIAIAADLSFRSSSSSFVLRADTRNSSASVGALSSTVTSTKQIFSTQDLLQFVSQ
jgi:hypothetical protein